MPRPLASFDDFVSINVESLLRTAYLITEDEGDAEDLVQDCLLTLAQRWGRVSAMDHPLAYARRVLVNLAARGSTKRFRRRVELGSDVVDAAADIAALELLGTRDELWAALRQLTPRQRAVLVFRYFHDLSERDVANTLGCSAATVSSTTSRSLAQLRRLIQPAQLQGDSTDGRPARSTPPRNLR